MHFAHGYLGASFYSPLANRRTDAYGGSKANRARFLLEAMDAVREVWPEEYPLTFRLGADDYHPDGVQWEDSIEVVGWLKEHGADMADLSMGGNTDDMRDPHFPHVSAWVERGARVRREIGIPVTVSWNLGIPANADRAIREEKLDLVMLGRPALANAHWPVWGPASSATVTRSRWSPRTGAGGCRTSAATTRASAGRLRRPRPSSTCARPERSPAAASPAAAG